MDSFVFFLWVFLIIFALNVAPAFAPATWTIISYISITYGTNILALAIVGAVAATLGRLVLARMSHLILRRRLLSEKTKRNIDVIKVNLESRKAITAGAFLFYAFSPFPSNNLFIAYGLTTMPLALITIPFFIGRVTSYIFWALSAEGVIRGLGFKTGESRSFFGYYFIAAQIVTLLLVYVFTKIDWKQLFAEKKLRWMK